MKKYFKLIVYTLLLVSISATANTKNIIVDIDGVKIHIKAPKGFYEISSISPSTRKFAENFTPKNTRLLGFFLNEEDLGRILKGENPLMQQHLAIKILRGAEKMYVTPKKFNELVSSAYNHYSNSIAKLITPGLKKTVETLIEDYINEKTSIASNVKIGIPVPIYASVDRTNVFTGMILTRVELDIDSVNDSYVSIASSSYVLLKGKMILIEVLNTYDSPEDIAWVKKKNTEWIDLLFSENK